MKENILPANCGPQCPLYDLSNRRCRVSGNPKENLEDCDFGYNMREVKNIAQGKPWNTIDLPVDMPIQARI